MATKREQGGAMRWDAVGEVRPARPDEAEVLSALAFRSKASWGYDTRLMDACRDELTVTRDAIERGDVFVLEAAGRVIGYYSFAVWKGDLELGHFFVEPGATGRAVGRALWIDAVRRATARGVPRLLIQSDPNAEGFYLKLGAERIDVVPSQALAGRLLPLLLYPLA